MPYIVSPDKAKLKAINKKINDYMMANIEGYNAVQWGEIKKHPTLEKYVLIINDDSRNPLKALFETDKNFIVDINESEWFPSIKEEDMA